MSLPDGHPMDQYYKEFIKPPSELDETKIEEEANYSVENKFYSSFQRYLQASSRLAGEKAKRIRDL